MPARSEQRWGRVEEAVHKRDAAEQGDGRLRGHRRRQVGTLHQVGKIGQQRVIRSAQGQSQIAGEEPYPVRHPEPLRVASGHREGGVADVGRVDVGLGQVMGDRDRDAAGAGTDVREPQDSRSPEATPFHRPLHEDLGVRVGHQHVRRNHEVEGHELPVASEVSDRLTAAAAAGQLAVGRQLRFLERPVELEVEVEPADAEDVGQQHLRVKSGRFRAVRLEVPGRSPEDLEEGQAAPWPLLSSPLS